MTDVLDGVRMCGDDAELTELAGAWRPGLPFPLRATAAVDRYRVLNGGVLPVPDRTSRVGTVLSVGGAGSRVAGRLLALATERPHRHVAPSAVLGEVAATREPVAVVGLAEDTEAIGDWPGAHNPSAGVLVARDVAALVFLVYRTLVPGAGASGRTVVVSSPFISGGMAADAVELADLGPLKTERPQLVVLNAHGRECSAGLPDAVICGRSAPETELVADLGALTGYRIPSCLRGAGCYRGDLSERQRVRAAELNAVLVFSQTCAAVAAGTNAFPMSVGLGTGFLDGTTVAVIGPLGQHRFDPEAPAELCRRLGERLPLGQVVAAMNASFDDYGLLGDPGLVLPAAAPPAHRGAPLTRPEARTILDGARRSVEEILPRCERLALLGVEHDGLPGIRGVVRDIATRETATVPDVADQLVALQLDIVRDEVASVWSNGADFLGSGGDGLAPESSTAVPCPSCRTNRAREVVLRHRADRGLVVRTVHCRRCGDVHWSTSDAGGPPPLSVAGPVDVDGVRGTRVQLVRELVNSGDRTARGAVGFAFQTRGEPVLPPGVAEEVTVPAHGVLRWTTEIDLTHYDPKPDEPTGVVMALLDGYLLASPVVLRLA